MAGFLNFKDRTEKFFFFLFLVPVLLILYGRVCSLSEFDTTIWSVRDFYRTLNLLNVFQVSGAEMSFGNGMRLPGGALYYLWFVPAVLTRSPAVLYAFMHMLDLIGAGVLFLTLNSCVGALAAVLGLCIYMSAFVSNCVMIQLWNPGFMPVFVMCAVYFLYRTLRGDWKFFRWFLLSCAFGIQMHLSVALLIFPALCSVLFVACASKSDVRGFVLRGILPGTVLFLIAFAPYIAVETVNGFSNTELILRQYFFRSYSGSMLERIKNFSGELRLLSGGVRPFLERQPFQSAPGMVPEFIGQYLFAVLALAGSVLSFVRVKKRSQLSGLAVFSSLLILQTLVLYYFFNSTLVLYPRYLFILVPGLTVLGSYAFSVIGGFLRERLGGFWIVRLFNSLVFCAVLVCGNVSMQFKPTPAYNGASLETCLNDVVRHTGWTMSGLASRTTVIVKTGCKDGKCVWQRDFDMACMTGFALARAGLPFPGSGPLPGAVVFMGGAGDDDLFRMDAKSFSRKYLLRDFDDVEILERVVLGPNLLVIYSRPTGLAFSGMSNKYIFLREEKIIARYVDMLVPKSAVFVADENAYVIDLDDIVYLLLRIEKNPGGGVDIGLFSNQLRGYTHNVGLFNDVTIEKPTLRWEKIGGTFADVIETIIYDDLVGLNGVFAPLRVHADIGPGRYRLSFDADVFDALDKHLVKPFKEYGREKTKVKVVLGEFEV